MSEARATDRRRLVNEARQPGQNYALYMSDDRANFFVDGIAGLSGGGAVANLDFFVVSEVTADTDPALGIREHREVKVRLTMPVGSLLEGLVNLIAIIQPQLDALQQASEHNAQAVAAQVQRLRAFHAGT